jgi:hypothetical protein
MVMKAYDKQILGSLVDRYEKSKLYSASSKQNQSISYPFNKQHLPEYFDDESMVYEKINYSMQQLETLSLISITWKNKRAGHIIDKVILNLEQLEAVYHYLKRPLKKVLEQDNYQILEEYKAKHPILTAFIQHIENRMKSNLPVKKYFDLENTTYLRQLLSALQGILTNEEECYMRELSMSLFNDSKVIEQMEAKMSSIITEFSPYDMPEAGEEVLAEFNIYKNPSYIMLKGQGIVQLRNSRFDLMDIPHGIGINSKDLDALCFLRNDGVKKLITIENLTVFNRFSEKGAVILYLGGYHNRARRQMIQSFYKVYPHITYYHWGDIDCGGMRIFDDLVKKTQIPFRPLNMDLTILNTYQPFCKPLTNRDLVTLKAMKEQKNYLIFNEVIDYMLQENIKLEQEIVAYKRKDDIKCFK